MNTQFAVCHLERAKGNDSGMSEHIERRKPDGKKYIPENADGNRTHLNRELIKFPEGVERRHQAIKYRIENAGLQRKVGKNQTQAIRVMLSGSPEQMKKLQDVGRLDEWISANLDWLRETFGNDNVVSCVLHMDEKTPHLHATVVPIVTEPRKRRAREGEKKNRTHNGPRLSADDVMTREKLRQYQNTYGEAMKKFGLERGLIGSDAFHKRKQDYNRQLTKQLQADVERINSELTVKQQELKETSEKVKDLQEKTSGVKNKLLSVVGKGEIPGLKKRIEELEKEVKDLKHEREQLKKKIEDLTADSLRQRNAYQAEIAKLQKEREKHLATIQEQGRVNQKLHRLAYPERYKLSSGAELKSFRIPNTLNPFAYITTLFNGKEFDTFSYMGNDLLNQYENGDLTEHEIVNQLFTPFEQIDQSQHPLLAQILQTASGGVATTQVGTGSGGSYDQSSWDGREHDPSHRKR